MYQVNINTILPLLHLLYRQQLLYARCLTLSVFVHTVQELEDGSWHFSNFGSSHHDLLTSNGELQGAPHQQCAAYGEVEGHSFDGCYHPRNSQVAGPRGQPPNFRQPERRSRSIRRARCGNSGTPSWRRPHCRHPGIPGMRPSNRLRWPPSDPRW